MVLVASASFWCSVVECSELPDDLDPWQQIAQHNNEHGQLRILNALGLFNRNGLILDYLKLFYCPTLR